MYIYSIYTLKIDALHPFQNHFDRIQLYSFRSTEHFYYYIIIILYFPQFRTTYNFCSSLRIINVPYTFCSQNSGVEMTWVIADFTATAAGQVTVVKGQQVELLDCCGGTSEMVLVRVPSDCTEGMVPHFVLKQPPSLKSPQATGKEKLHRS